MIEPDCAGCTTNLQDAQHSTPNDHQQLLHNPSSTTPTTASRQQTANQSQRNISTPPPVAIKYPADPQIYFQHNNLQPLVGPHFLLASSAAPAGLLAPSPLGGQTAQFALTPDARACVTATYLCVLIVNNTWLDCNLLETLCNNQQNNGNHDDGNDDDDKTSPNATLAEATMKLNALESALSELIAFAGGGGGSGGLAADDMTQSGSSAPDRVYHPLPFYFRPEEPNFSSLRPMEPYVDKGGGADGMNSEATTQSYNGDHHHHSPDEDEEFHNFESPFRGAPMARLRSLEPDDQDVGGNVQVREHVLANNRVILDELEKKDRADKKFSVQQQQQQQQHQADNSSKAVANMGSTQAPSSTGSLASWMGRPFRSWGSYSFWSSGSGNHQVIQDQPKQPQKQQQQQQQQQQQVQLLRPMDRTELYNDIVTNQSSLKQQSIGVQQQLDHRHQQQPEKSGFPATGAAGGGLTTNDAIVLVASSNNGLTRGNSNDADNNNSNNQPVFAYSQSPAATLGQSQQHLPARDSNSNGDGDNDNDDISGEPSSRQKSTPQPIPIFRTPTTPAASLMAIYSETQDSPASSNSDGSYAQSMTTPGSMQRQQQQQQQQQTDRNVLRHHHFYHLPSQQQHHHHHVHQLQKQQPFHNAEDQMAPQVSPDPSQCKCPELLDGRQLVGHPASPADECRFRCPQLAASAASQSLTPSQVFNNDVTQLATATTFAAPTTTLGPSGKMSPLDVTFQLYTRNNRDQSTNGDTIGLTNETSLINLEQQQQQQQVSSSASGGVGQQLKLNSSLPIKIVIHGFGSGGRRPWVTDMVYKLLDYEDVNVIVVDWEKGAALPNYVQAAGNTRLVGHKIAGLIKSINAKYGLTGNSYHLIGFSLGAHVAGFAGMEIRNSTNVPRLWINRITCLDPASPLFEGYEANDRLDPSDAQFVDVIHSNGDGVLRGGFGSLQPMGHVDFYPNGGRVQVGCNSVLLSALSDIIYGKWQSLCNHRRALNFFMDSFEFNKCRFRSFNCDSYENYLKGECFDCGHNNEKCSYMGYLANYSKGRGKMYLTTHEEAPFCANQFIIKIVGTKGFKTHWGKVEVTLVTLDGKNESFWLSSMSQQSTGGVGGGGGSGSASGHELGGANGHQKELNQQQHCMQSLIVAHPVLVNFAQVLLRYTKYKGWIYSGDESWSIDKIFITDSDGQVKSYCGFNTILESHVTSRLNLEPGNCTVIEPMASPGASIVQTVGGQQVSHAGNEGNPSTNGQTVSPVPLPPQQQSQSSSQSPIQQQQQPQPTQSSRTPRFDYSPGHAFQRIAATERPGAPFTIGYNNIPYISSF